MKVETFSVVAAACLTSAAAFVAPSAFGKAIAARPAATMQMAASDDMEGALPPLGLWDPLGLLNDADEERFNRLRYVEVKHGRISMLAVLGYIVQSQTRLPGYLSISEDIKFADVPNGFGAFSKIPLGGLAQIILFIGFLELAVMKQVPNGIPGDFNRFGSSAWESWDEDKKRRKRNIEINNGRAAQMGILGLMVHEQLNGHPFVINDLLGVSTSFPFPG